MGQIIVGFSKPKGGFQPFSWLIRLVTWSPISHAYIKYYNSYADRWVIFQASGSKVNVVGETLFNNIENIYSEFSIPVSASTKQKVIQGSIDKLGAPYGIKQIIGFGWVLLMRLLRRKVKNPFYSTSSFFCSELTSDELEEMGLNGLDASAVSPWDVYKFIVSKGFKAN